MYFFVVVDVQITNDCFSWICFRWQVCVSGLNFCGGCGLVAATLTLQRVIWVPVLRRQKEGQTPAALRKHTQDATRVKSFLALDLRTLCRICPYGATPANAEEINSFTDYMIWGGSSFFPVEEDWGTFGLRVETVNIIELKTKRKKFWTEITLKRLSPACRLP